MAKPKNSSRKSSRKANKNHGLPGTIYLNKNRYWWKVQLPGEPKPKARPLKPVGSKFATIDRNVAVEVAQSLYQTAIFESGKENKSTEEINTSR